MHPWHDISAHKNTPSVCHAVVEIPKGSRAKYEIDKPSGLIKLDRVLRGSMMYPLHYGIIPQTLFDDGDPLDVMIITQVTLVPLTLVNARIIGIMRMIDEGIPDDKILAVAEGDPSVSNIYDIEDVPLHLKLELKDFFENYTVLEGKSVQVPTFLDKQSALAKIEYARDLYDQKFKEFTGGVKK